MILEDSSIIQNCATGYDEQGRTQVRNPVSSLRWIGTGENMTSTKATHALQDIVRKGMETKEEEKLEWEAGVVWEQAIHLQISTYNGVKSLGTVSPPLMGGHLKNSLLVINPRIGRRKDQAVLSKSPRCL